MFWNFILDDGTTQLTLETQPVGWDSGTAHITRDTDKHGVAFDYAIGNVKYYREGFDFLKAAYEALGTEAKVNLIIEYKCSENSDWQEFYTGKLDFGTYKEFRGVDCYIMINIEATDVVMTFNNRFDQKVDLETTVSFDGVTLPAYPALGINIDLRSKAIPVQDYFQQKGTTALNYAGGLQAKEDPASRNWTESQFTFGFNTDIATEIGGTSTSYEEVKFAGNDYIPKTTAGFDARLFLPICNGLTPTTLKNPMVPMYSSPTINLYKDSPSFGWLNGNSLLDVKFAGTFSVINCYVRNISWAVMILRDKGSSYVAGCDDDHLVPPHPNGEYSCDYITENCGTLKPETIVAGGEIYDGGNFPYTFLNPGQSVNFDLDFTKEINILDGDRVYMLISYYEEKTPAQISTVTAGATAYSITLNDGNYLKLSNTSYGGSNAVSACKSFLVNESLSRITEAITNGQMRAYSSYFGRTDSKPYSVANDGCGGLEMITNGLFIRRINEVKTDTPPQLNLSLKDMFDGLNPIHNIGYGFEDDPNRAGYKMLRVEPMQYFYPNNVIFSAANIPSLTRECQPAKIYSVYKFGYSKWEAQQFTGLDEFLTSREYRTSLTSVSNTLSQVSSFIASGYTIEIVRRIGNTTSQDNSYDNSTFIVCVRKAEQTAFNVVTTYNPITHQLNVSGVEFSEYVASFGNGKVLFTYNGTIYYLIPSSYDTQAGTVTSYSTDFTLTGINTPRVFMSYSGTYEVEQGNVINPQNIIDPDTIYNFRISPVRNAMRWVKSIFQSYVNLSEQLIYTDSDGNVYAKGQLPAGDPCKLENSDVQENQTITPAMFQNVNDSVPVFSPELITFEYPVSLEDFINIKSNRMGLIEYEYNGVTEQGWIFDLQYTFETGKAVFQLIPKFE